MATDGTRGVLYALGAAAINGTIGVFSKTLVALGLPTPWIAFCKTVIAWVVLSMVWVWLRQQPRTPDLRDGQRGSWGRHARVALAAALGILCLFAFETAAYETMPAATVVVLLMATSVIAANLASWGLLGRRPAARQWAGTLMTIGGIAIMLGVELGSFPVTGMVNGEPSVPSPVLRGTLHACLAGLGYGLFTVLLKRFGLMGGLSLTRQLLMWGSFYLLWPALPQPLEIHLLTVPAVVVSLLCLATLPTILGFYCTTRAVDLLPPEKVQLLELSEPVFAALLALVFLGESISATTLLGGLTCVAGIYFGAHSTRQ